MILVLSIDAPRLATGTGHKLLDGHSVALTRDTAVDATGEPAGSASQNITLECLSP